MIASIALLLFANSPLDQVRDRLKPFQTFEVKFSQEVEQDLFAQEIESPEGKIEFKKPNRFVWKYMSPESMKKEIRFDGESLQVDGEKVPLASGVRLEQAFAFLWGDASSELFDIEAQGKNKLVLKVKPGIETSFEKIEVEIKDALIAKAIVSGRFGDKSILKFNSWELR